jgi:hypothetical protein
VDFRRDPIEVSAAGNNGDGNLIHGDLTMSTVTTLAPPIPAVPPPTRRRGGAPEGDQRIAIRNVSWDLYERLSKAISETQNVFLAYDAQDLEFMTKGPDY